MQNTRDALERHQISIYFVAVVVATVVAWVIPGTAVLEGAINPALALMLLHLGLLVQARPVK